MFSWRTYSIRRKCRYIGACVAIGLITWFAIIGQLIVYADLQGRLPDSIAVLGLFWMFFIIGPTRGIARRIGWDWGENLAGLTAGQWCATLLLNALMWGLAGVIVGHLFGSFGGIIMTGQWQSISAKRL